MDDPRKNDHRSSSSESSEVSEPTSSQPPSSTPGSSELRPHLPRLSDEHDPLPIEGFGGGAKVTVHGSRMYELVFVKIAYDSGERTEAALEPAAAALLICALGEALFDLDSGNGEVIDLVSPEQALELADRRVAL